MPWYLHACNTDTAGAIALGFVNPALAATADFGPAESFLRAQHTALPGAALRQDQGRGLPARDRGRYGAAKVETPDDRRQPRRAHFRQYHRRHGEDWSVVRPCLWRPSTESREQTPIPSFRMSKPSRPQNWPRIEISSTSTRNCSRVWPQSTSSAPRSRLIPSLSGC